jgi:Zn-dependent protease with chaperone function
MSHLILGHVSQRNSLETALRTVEVLLLSLDPTEGAASLAVIGGLAWLRGMLVASFSREHESEADELGVILAARACYNTQLGSNVMKKMYDHQVRLAGEPTTNSHLLHLLDTHPPTLDRYHNISKQSETENPQKYHSNCATIQQRMIQAVFGRPS